MAQYSAKHVAIEAYCFGNATVPAWVTAAQAAKRIVHQHKSTLNGAMVRDHIAVQTEDGVVSANTGDYIIQHADGSFSVMGATAFTALYLYDNAGLTSVLTLTDATVETAAGTTADPILWELSVANEVATVGLTNIVAATNATKNLYSDATFETEITGESTIALTAGDETVAYIKVTSEYGTLVQCYAVTITRAAGA